MEAWSPQHQQTSTDQDREHVRALIKEGADQLDRGEIVDGDELFQRWEEIHGRFRSTDIS